MNESQYNTLLSFNARQCYHPHGPFHLQVSMSRVAFCVLLVGEKDYIICSMFVDCSRHLAHSVKKATVRVWVRVLSPPPDYIRVLRIRIYLLT